MPRISGIDLPLNKQIGIGLTYIFGIGRTNSKKILSDAKIPGDKRVKDLSDEEVTKIRNVIEKNATVEGGLRTQRSMNVKRLMEIGCYRGLRHRRGLPVRGQRTKTNARSRKGAKKTVANKKVAPKG